MKEPDQPHDVAMREYLKARLRQLAATKSVEEIAREAGFTSTKPLEMLANGSLRVGLASLLPLSRALEAPLLPFFKLAMEQWGLGELAAAICDRVGQLASTAHQPPASPSKTPFADQSTPTGF